MAKLVWDAQGEHFYEAGSRNAVLYPKDATGAYAAGVAWNGLTAVTESPSGAEETALYADDAKYLSLYSAEEFGCTIEAYTYPDEWAECDGSKEIAPGVLAGQQARKGFGFSYRTILGNDDLGEAYGYKLHIVYNAMASPSEKSYSTINDSPEAITFSWEVKTTPIRFDDNLKPTAILTITSTKVGSEKMAALEAILYGSEDSEPRLPTPQEVVQLLSADTNSDSGNTDGGDGDNTQSE